MRKNKMNAASLTSLQRWSILGGAAILLSLSMGMRQSFGLFQPHMVRDLGITMADFSLAMAIQNAVWGLTQPLVGMFADRHGVRSTMLAGVIVYMAGLGLMTAATSATMLTIGAGVCIGFALSCTASSITMSVTSRAVTAAKRSATLGAVAAAGSLGLTIASPMAQILISTSGWQVALIGFLALSAVMIPAALGAGLSDKIEVPAAESTTESVGGAVRTALGHSGYVVMALAFFVCGLQLVFLTNHLPTYLAVCGVDPAISALALSAIGFFNIIGCYTFGWLGGRYPKQWLLGGLYVARSLAIGIYFSLPATATSTLVFAAVMGVLWLAVSPLITGLVAQLFGLRYMATLSGITFLTHQTGSFLGAWGGGVIYDALGSYDAAWKAAVLIGLIAGVFQMMMNVKPPVRKEGVPVAPVLGTA